MTPTAWALAALVPLAVALCVWAAATGGAGPEWRHESVRQPAAHSRRNREERTQRLRPPAPPQGWIPYPERPGGEAQPLPPPDDLPWPRR